jgi:predicted aminopeptidase
MTMLVKEAGRIMCGVLGVGNLVAAAVPSAGDDTWVKILLAAVGVFGTITALFYGTLLKHIVDHKTEREAIGPIIKDAVKDAIDAHKLLCDAEKVVKHKES